MKNSKSIMFAALIALVGAAGASPANSASAAAAAQSPDSSDAKDKGVAGRPYHVMLDVKIPMRDGVDLSGTIFLPADQKEPLPVILLLTPYVADSYSDVGVYFAQHGYVFASVDVRGRGNSGGDFVSWTIDGVDGNDAVDWLSRQSWSDGQVTMWGGSYAGKNQWMIAGEAHPALKTIVPAAAGLVGDNIGLHNSNIHRPFNFNWVMFTAGNTSNRQLAKDNAYWLGAYADLARGDVSLRNFDKLAGYPSAIWQKWMDHPRMDAFWDAASIAPENYKKIRIPTLSITGMHDGSNTGTQKFRQWHLDAVGADVAAQSYIVIGPWDHPGTRAPKRVVGGVDLGEAAMLDIKGLHVAWYDHVMKGAPLPAFLKDHFVYYVMGANEWRAAPDAASATGRKETMRLSSPSTSAGSIKARGALVAEAHAQEPDSYVYDPSHPGYNEGFEGDVLVSENYLTDDGLMARLDGDGLVYDTAPLKSAADLVGAFHANLRLSMDVPDTDIRVALYEVKKNGDVLFLAQDQVRARYRKSLRAETLVTPGVVDDYEFREFPFVAHTIGKGSALRMVIAPLGASIHNERNRNSGGAVADETVDDSRIANVSVELGPEGSSLVIPWAE